MITLTRQQLLLAGLMVVAAAALAYDRLTATAAVDSQFELSDDEPTIPARVSLAAGGDEATLAARLRTLVSEKQTEAGTRSSPFEPVHRTGPDDNSHVPTSSRWSQRVLSGVVLRSDGLHVAIVDGKAIVMGTELDGLQLTAVSRDVAVFSNGSMRISLRSRK
jgi:hypothetical protein